MKKLHIFRVRHATFSTTCSWCNKRIGRMTKAWAIVEIIDDHFRGRTEYACTGHHAHLAIGGRHD